MAAAKGNKYACKYTDKDMQEICDKLLDWAENSKSIHLANFTRKVMGKSKQWLDATAEHYPQLAEAKEEAMDLIAAKMVDACYRDKESGVNATFGEKYLPVYDKEYKALLEWKALLAKQSSEDSVKMLEAMLAGVKMLNKDETEN